MNLLPRFLPLLDLLISSKNQLFSQFFLLVAKRHDHVSLIPVPIVPSLRIEQSWFLGLLDIRIPFDLKTHKLTGAHSP